MGGTPPTSSVLPGLLLWTKPGKETSVTEARAQQQLFLKLLVWIQVIWLQAEVFSLYFENASIHLTDMTL